VNFEEFQNQSRLYVIDALEPEEVEEFERECKKFGKKAEGFITQCSRREIGGKERTSDQ